MSIVSSASIMAANKFKFMQPFEDVSPNGLYLNNIYLPEEVIMDILSYIPPKKLLELTLVCKKWCNIIKSHNIWMTIYNKRYSKKAKVLPWYVFYCYCTTSNFDNLLKNGNGQKKMKHWKIIYNCGNGFKIENPPCGSDLLPANVSDFHGHSSCFATSYGWCKKEQKISLKNKRLLRYIVNEFKPHIYVSEWVAGRFDCACIYNLEFKGYDENVSSNCCFSRMASKSVQQWEGSKWEKVELLIDEYPSDISELIFEHKGHDRQFWRGHYGSKMAGGVVQFLFDSINPLEDAI